MALGDAMFRSTYNRQWPFERDRKNPALDHGVSSQPLFDARSQNQRKVLDFAFK